MSEGVLGIDIGNVDTGIVFYSDNEGIRFPTVICRDKVIDEWYIGEEAFNKVLSNEGVIVERVLDFAVKNLTTTLCGTKYTGRELIKFYFKKIIDKYKEADKAYPKIICCAVDNLCKEYVELITTSFLELGYLNENIYVISKDEAFIYYIRSKKKELWNNRVGLFYSYENTLKYYEMVVDRYARYEAVKVDCIKASGFVEKSVINNCKDIAKLIGRGDEQKIKQCRIQLDMADNILYKFAEDNIGNKIFSSIFLTGNSFEDVSWAKKSLSVIKSRADLFYEKNLFALGACYRGYDLSKEDSIFKFVSICNGRTDKDIYIRVDKNGKKQEYMLVSAGDLIYKADKKFRLLLNEAKDLRIEFRSIGKNKVTTYCDIPLDSIPRLNDKIMRVDINTYFVMDNTFCIEVEDAGFGDIFKKTDAKIKKEVSL